MRRNTLRVGALTAAMALLCAAAATFEVAAAPPLAFPIDVRTAGMGMTYVGVIGEPGPGTANPASFGFEVDNSALLAGATLSLNPTEAAGYLAIRDIDRGAGGGGMSLAYCRDVEGATNAFHGTYQVGKALTEWLSLGLGAACSASSPDGSKPSSYLLTSEAGAVIRLGALRIGAVVSDISATTFMTDEEATTVFAPMLSAGVALQTRGGVTLAIDAHDIVSAAADSEPWYSGGAEVRLASKLIPGSSFAFRAGAAFGGDVREDRPSYTAGIGFDSGAFSLGYAVIGGGGGPVVHCIGLGGSF